MQDSWLFQADPLDYDLKQEIQKGRNDDWELNQHRRDVNDGDRVIFWQSGEAAGIYGLGTLAGEAFEKDGKLRINIEYAELLGQPILKADLLKDDRLRHMLILTMPFGKNPFRVKAEEWQGLAQRIALNSKRELRWRVSFLGEMSVVGQERSR